MNPIPHNSSPLAFDAASDRTACDAPKLITLGCRLNAYESEVMRRHAVASGLTSAVIVNTCAVTSEAVRQAMQTIRRARRDQPDATIIVTGCAAQTEPERFAAMPEIDHVIGNGDKTRAETWKDLATAANPQRVRVNDIMAVRETTGHLIDGYGHRSRAIVQIQNGCDHRCTFCIIPFGRGPSRSVPPGEVVRQIERLVAEGYAEVVLTGVDITSYGTDLSEHESLGRLVRRVLTQVPDLARLRLSSIDQVEADPDLIAAIADEPRLMPHLHLSLQAGDDLILKRMKRRHLRADAIRFCRDVRKLRPDIAFGADIIAGFPTETEAMFQRSIDLVDACGLAYLHVFPYATRPGTPAARMPQVAGPAIKERAARLRTKGRAVMQSHLSRHVGATLDVLMEMKGIGRARDFTAIELPGISAGTMVKARAIAVNGERLTGEVL